MCTEKEAPEHSEWLEVDEKQEGVVSQKFREKKKKKIREGFQEGELSLRSKMRT